MCSGYHSSCQHLWHGLRCEITEEQILASSWDWNHRFGPRSEVIRWPATNESIWESTSAFTASLFCELSDWSVPDRTAWRYKETIDSPSPSLWLSFWLSCPWLLAVIVTYILIQFLSLYRYQVCYSDCLNCSYTNRKTVKGQDCPICTMKLYSFITIKFITLIWYNYSEILTAYIQQYSNIASSSTNLKFIN